MLYTLDNMLHHVVYPGPYATPYFIHWTICYTIIYTLDNMLHYVLYPEQYATT